MKMGKWLCCLPFPGGKLMVYLEFCMVLNVKPAADIKQKLSLWLRGNDSTVPIFLEPLLESSEVADGGTHLEIASKFY